MTTFAYEGVTHAGIAVVAADTGRVLLARRAYDAMDDADTRETWEFPGGSLNEGEDPESAAFREFSEEIGADLPEGEVINGWRGSNEIYQGFVYQVPTEFALGYVPTDEVQAAGWFNADEISGLGDSLRPEMSTMDWSLVFPETTDEGADMADDPTEYSDLHPMPLKMHGVLAPEATPSGDSRGFNDGAVTARPLRLPFGWQEWTAPGHDSSITVGSIDRMMRKDGLIHWEGTLMSSEKADEFVDLLSFMGQYGISIDGVNGSLDAEKSSAEGMAWFDAVKVAGAVACSIPAFAEAYVRLGPHPEMPVEDEATDALVASGDLIGRSVFGRGPGFYTEPGQRIHDYWTKKGQPGYAKVAWGTPGDFTRAKALIGEKIAANSPDKLRFLNQIIAQWHHDALGYWPGDLDKPGNKTTAEARAERKARVADLSVEADSLIASEDDESAWEAVLVSSVAGGVVRPPTEYFQRHPNTGATVIEEPDENGIRRTYGYAAQWGVCHIGFDNKCVEPPRTYSDTYPEFHLGRTKTVEGFVTTGLLTYNVPHRDAAQILSETATQAHFDNLKSAWAAVRVGEDETGIWFSGVVLPKVDEDDLTLIQASGQVSGEWKHGAMRALLTVNTPGFPVEGPSVEFDDNGNVVALVASAFGQVPDSPCAPTAAERMAALALVDAEIRFAALKEQYLAERIA